MLNDRSHLLVSHDRLADRIRAARSQPLAAVTPVERRGSGPAARILSRLSTGSGRRHRGPVTEPT
jgi:hypothetical protein